MTLHISCEQARRFLALYHFTSSDIPGVIERLATVQYDPLNPVGRNPELLDALRLAVKKFLHYLRAENVQVHESIDRVTRQTIQGAIH